MTEKGLLIVADCRHPASWKRAEALEEAARAAGRTVLLRDAAEKEIFFDFVDRIPEEPFQFAHRHLFKDIEGKLAAFFQVGETVFVPPLPEKVAAVFREMGPFHEAVERAELPQPARPPRWEAAYSSALVVTQDLMPHATKTSQTILRGCRMLGLPAMIRDTSRLRLMADGAPVLNPDPETVWRETRQRVEELYAAFPAAHRPPGAPGAAVLALDLNWFFDRDLFLDDPAYAQIFSFWFDDPKSWCGEPSSCFPGALERFQEALRHPKVTHCCYGQGQRDELRALGIDRTRLSFLAAPPEYLRHRAAPEVTERAAFIGNPGLRFKPPPSIVALLEKGAELDMIRAEARRHAMSHALTYLHRPISREPTVRAWLAEAFVMRAAEPYTSATALLVRAARNFPRAIEAVNETGEILNAAMFVKMSNHFDRPALVHRLWRAGLLDVISSPEEWEPYGVTAAPSIAFPALPAAYQRYACHVNSYNCLRDATANEKLFEIAACGRVSVNLLSPDVRRCYADGEVACVGSLAEAEARLRGFLADPEEALAWGERARHRTALQHLWTHRLRDLLTKEAP